MTKQLPSALLDETQLTKSDENVSCSAMVDPWQVALEIGIAESQKRAMVELDAGGAYLYNRFGESHKKWDKIPPSARAAWREVYKDSVNTAKAAISAMRGV